MAFLFQLYWSKQLIYPSVQASLLIACPQFNGAGKITFKTFN